jgi:hypothetical protein
VQITSHIAIVGFIPPAILDCLCEVDPRFLRVLTRNYHRMQLDTVRPAVPMLRYPFCTP